MAGLNCSFEGSRFPEVCESTIFCSHGDVDGSNNLIDHSGSNLLTYTEDFSNAAWTKTNVTVTADQVLGPESSNADLLTPTAADSYVYQDVTATIGTQYTCSFYLRSVTGSVSLSIHAYDQAHGTILGTKAIVVTPFWQRFSIEGIPVAGDTDIGCTIGGNNTWSTGENIYAVRAQVAENNEWNPRMGIYHPCLAGTNLPLHNLAPTNAPTAARAHLQSGGNKMAARGFDGINQYYSKAHHASMDINDGDHTYTFFLEHDSGAAGSDRFFSHGSGGADGLQIFSNGLAAWRARYSSGAGDMSIDYVATTNDDRYHIIQVVRDGNTGIVYYDGTASVSADLTGYGIDGARTFAIGATSTGTNPWDGQISYTVIRSRALSLDELAEEREKLLAITTNMSPVNHWDFSRSTVAYKTFSNAYENTYPSHSMDLVAVDAPRVAGRGSGLLIEGDVTQLHGLTEELDSWLQNGVCAVTANDYVAPNGTLTVDELDNTGGGNNDHRRVTTVDLGALGGRTFTGSIWVRADTPHNVSIRIFENPAVGSTEQVYYATNEWQRIHVSRICAGGGVNTLSCMVLPGERLVATGIAHFWGGNLTETTFATSYIPNAGVATTQVTKTADDMTIDPHPVSGSNSIILPEFFTPAGANKLTVYFEAKCEYSGAADIGQQRQLVEISGNSGTASSSRNRYIVLVQADGRIYSYMRDDSDVDHTINTGVDPVDFSKWFSVRTVYDFSDFSRMDMWVRQLPDDESNAGMTYAGDSGSDSFDTTNTLIRLGQDYAGPINGFMKIRNLRITPSEIRP